VVTQYLLDRRGFGYHQTQLCCLPLMLSLYRPTLLWVFGRDVYKPKNILFLSSHQTDYITHIVFLSSLIILAKEIYMKSTIFWDITPCSSLKVNRLFGGTYRIHLQARISQARYQRESRLTFNRLHAIISQKIVLFITTAVRTSNPTKIYMPLDHFDFIFKFSSTLLLWLLFMQY
jgi:hypothetical protein